MKAAAVIAVCGSVLAGAPFAHAIQLADGGTALQPIVIAGSADATTRAAAEELRAVLETITGTVFSLQPGDGSSGIVVGTLAEFPDGALSEPLAIHDEYDGVEAYAIRTDSNRLRLVGATSLGASHAVYAFLEHLGCRWFFPSEEWTVLPSIPTLSVNLNVDDRPDLLCRRIWYGYGFFDRSLGTPRDAYNTWARRNRMAQSHTVYCGHAWQAVIAANQATFDAHPEYYALVSTNRQGPQLCVSNPDVRTIVRDWALDYLETHPEADMVSLDPADGSGHCECSNCLAMGSISDRVFGLANEVADAVAVSHPGKMVGILAYNDHSEIPSFSMRPNVHVQLTRGFTRGAYTFDELLELWPGKCRNMGLYDYYSVFLWDWDMVPGGRAANMEYLRESIPEYVDRGMLSMSCESGNNWGLHGRGYVVANRLMWNANADVDALLADFYTKAFGPAAAAMQRYYERVDPGGKPLLSEDLIALAFRDVSEASVLAAGHPDVQARLDHIKQYLRFVHLYWEYRHGPTEQAREDAALAALTHCYRTRYSYMNHWAAMQYGWTPRLADEFDEPTWDYRDPEPPWKIEAPVSHEETETAFLEGLSRFQATPVTEATFSDDLIPAGFISSSPAGLSQQFMRGARYAFYSTNGSPISYRAVPGTVAWYRDRADARLTLTDPQTNTVSETRLPLDGEIHAVSTPLPRAGLYWLDISDSGAGLRLETDPAIPCVLRLERGRRYHHSGHMKRCFFYVPNGVTNLQYFISNPTDHELYGPDGSLYQTVTNSDVFVSVSLPSGTDGCVWSLKKIALGQLWFFNCPNVLAASPDALLLPRELVARDGLPGAGAQPDRAPRITCAPGPGGLTETGAVLNAELLFAYDGTASVSFCWGETNGGFNTSNWTHVDSLGQCPTGLLSQAVGTQTGTCTRYQVYAVDAHGWCWAPHAREFDTGSWPWPFVEDFESCRSGALQGQRGWEATATDVAEVQTRKRHAGIRGARLSGGTLRRSFRAPTDTNTVWIELFSQPRFGFADTPPPDGVSAAFFVNHNGRLVAYDGTEAVTLTNGPVLALGEWVRFVLCLDYARHRWDLWCRDALVARGFRFYTPETSALTAFAIRDEARRESFHDDISISTLHPPDITPAFIDDDRDGLPDAWERHHFGTLAQGATNDPDTDALCNLDECGLGTDPRDADTDDDGASDWKERVAGTSGTNRFDLFMVSEISHGVTPGSILLRWNSVSGRTYKVYVATPPYGTWLPLVQNIPGDGTRRTVTLKQVPDEVFFRLGVSMPEQPTPLPQ